MKLKIGSLFLVVLMVFQLCFFCPCTYAGYNELMRMLKEIDNVTIEDIRPIVEANPIFVRETCSSGYDREIGYGGIVRLTVLHYAICYGHNTDSNRAAIVQYLIEKGADPNSDVADGNTPLYFAIRDNRDACVRMLLDKGADPNKGDKRGLTPLHEAVILARDNYVLLLLDRGADPNKGYREGDFEYQQGITPLHLAARLGWKACVQVLLDKGVDPNCKDGGGSTPLDKCKSAQITAKANKKHAEIKALIEVETLLKSHGGKESSMCIIS